MTIITSIYPLTIGLKGINRISGNKKINDRTNLYELRSLYIIASFDDEEILHKKRLKDSGFNIRYYSNISELETGFHPQIFICDILGVDPDSEFDGVLSMAELRKRYPVSAIIGYSSLAQTDFRFQEAKKYCDQVIRKSDLTDNLVNALDDHINLVNDPKLLWVKIRNYLYSKGYETREIALFEHYYVLSLTKSDPEFLKKKVGRCFQGDDISNLLGDIGPAIVKTGFSVLM